MSVKSVTHRWSNGMMIAFQAIDPGSTPGRCIFYVYFNFKDLKNTVKIINNYSQTPS